MKRRPSIKEVRGAARTAALRRRKKPVASRGKNKRAETPTYGLSPISSAAPNSPFTLPVRPPGWFPDGVDIGTKKRQRLFQEEVVGVKKTGVTESFPVEFDYTGTSKKWILGSRIDPSQPSFLTRLIQRLAVRLRQYNASLYRLRRLHFFWHYRDADPERVKFPPANPSAGPRTAPDPKNDAKGFRKMVGDAEADWIKVTSQVNDLLETASSDGNNFGVKLLAADMIAANGYIVSVRIVARLPGASDRPAPGKFRTPLQVGGSSSHVSISSAFSSSSPNPSSSLSP